MKPNYNANKYHPTKTRKESVVLIQKPSQTGPNQQKTPDATSEQTAIALSRRKTTDAENTHVAKGAGDQRTEKCSTANATSEIHENHAGKSTKYTDREKSCTTDGDDEENRTREEIATQGVASRKTGDHIPEYGRGAYSANKLGSIHRIAAMNVDMGRTGSIVTNN